MTLVGPHQRDRLFLTFIRHEGNIGERAKLPESPASKSSGASFQRFHVAESMGLRANFADSNTLLQFEDK